MTLVSSVMVGIMAAITITMMGLVTLPMSNAFNDTFELANYHRYNVSLMHDNSSLYNSSDWSIKWSVEPTTYYYKFTYADDLQFILTSSYDTNGTSNETTCSYFVTLHDRYSVHVTLLNESLDYCTPTGYWD